MPRKLLQLIPGLILYGIADAFMIRAAIGVDSWTVFAQGLAVHSGFGIGIITNVTGLIVLLLWWPLRQKPGLGTILNILLVGPGIELGLWLLPTPEEMWLRIAYFVLGMLLLALASGIYIGARLGPGPRDGLMTGIHLRFGTPIWIGRTGVELTVLLVGWLLGGNVGFGTLAFALLIGPLCGITLPLFDRRWRNDPEGHSATQQSDEDQSISAPSGTLL
ncbi:YczE/YyaS/YitT family protein [Leucobacter viscericola]|uniref:membrane protein YczE n=1 Tax=Leucobacter viscericola TaxID=2714935 RepID=UPI001FCAFB68|nr:hypothetical protein [Leucobacter viscericola]